MIRAAEERDAEAMAVILNHAIRPGVNATARVDPSTPEERSKWLRQLQPPYGAWVYESGAGVLGWCSLGPFVIRRGYDSVAEISAYVHAEHWRSGVGARLLATLVYEGRARGFRSLMSIAFEKNVVSLSGCLAAGFEPCAVLLGVATTRDGYGNVSWIHKDLSQDDPPILRAELRRITRANQHEPGLVAFTGGKS